MSFWVKHFFYDSNPGCLRITCETNNHIFCSLSNDNALVIFGNDSPLEQATWWEAECIFSLAARAWLHCKTDSECYPFTVGSVGDLTLWPNPNLLHNYTKEADHIISKALPKVQQHCPSCEAALPHSGWDDCEHMLHKPLAFWLAIPLDPLQCVHDQLVALAVPGAAHWRTRTRGWLWSARQVVVWNWARGSGQPHSQRWCLAHGPAAPSCDRRVAELRWWYGAAHP